MFFLSTVLEIKLIKKQPTPVDNLCLYSIKPVFNRKTSTYLPISIEPPKPIVTKHKKTVTFLYGMTKKYARAGRRM